MSGNWFSIIALGIWPVVAALLYKGTGATFATVWTILGAHLLLPAEVVLKIPMIPGFDKNSIPNLCAALGCIVFASSPKRKPLRSRIGDVLVLAYVCSPILTSAFNNDPIVLGGRVVPGVGNYDAISAGLSQLIFLIPLLVGRRLVQSAEDIETILRGLVLAGLLYSVPMLFEIRMSPQLSSWIYGYSSTSYAAEGRYGGFRPVVFMNNGLVVAFFITTSFVASIALLRAKLSFRVVAMPSVTLFLGTLVVLCKSAGSLLYGIFGGLSVALIAPKIQSRITVVLVSIGLLYPVLRLSDVFPTQLLVQAATSISDERGSIP